MRNSKESFSHSLSVVGGRVLSPPSFSYFPSVSFLFLLSSLPPPFSPLVLLLLSSTTFLIMFSFEIAFPLAPSSLLKFLFVVQDQAKNHTFQDFIILNHFPPDVLLHIMLYFNILYISYISIFRIWVCTKSYSKFGSIIFIYIVLCILKFDK